MTSQQLLIPLRIPELGPFMGKVVTGSGAVLGELNLDQVRQRLATRIFEAAGEARRLAGREERHAAVATIGRATWLEAWEEAVGAVATLVAEQAARNLEAEARAARLPRRKRKRLLPDEAERRAIASRLGSAGAALVPALDQIELRTEGALEATALERAEVEAWQDTLRTSARRMEAAWLDLERAVVVETLRWERLAAEVSLWRRPWWPVVVTAVLALAAAAWLGLVFGGQLQAPTWFAGLWQQVVGQ